MSKKERKKEAVDQRLDNIVTKENKLYICGSTRTEKRKKACRKDRERERVRRDIHGME